MTESAAVAVSGFALFDDEDLMLGDETGPNVYADEEIAACAATVVSIMFKRPYRVEPYSGHGKMRDVAEPSMSAIDALRIAESPTGSRRPRRPKTATEEPPRG